MDQPLIKGHKLRKNAKATLPSTMLFYDSETKYTVDGKEQHHTLDFGWVCYCRRRPGENIKTVKHYFIDSKDRFNSLVEKHTQEKKVLYIFGHNIFFDIQVSGFFEYFARKGWTLDFIYDKGLTYILTIRYGSKKITCLSTTNYFDHKLEVLGETIGRKKIEIDLQRSSREEKIEYCYNDMMIIKEAMEYYFAFLEEHDTGKFGLTKSAQAFSFYRHRFMQQAIFIHEEEKAVELERLAYHGGRTEAFKIGEIDGGPFACCDYNSMYPVIMQTKELPYRLIDYGGELSLSELETALSVYAMVAEVKLNTDKPIYAIKRNGKLIYPVGSFDAFLCTPALIRALSAGHIQKVYRCAIYEKANLFESYVNYIFSLRHKYKETGNDVYQLLCKYFANCLYGKFGQKRMVQEKHNDNREPIYFKIKDIDLMTGEQLMSMKLFNTWIVDVGEVNGKNSFVAIAAHITEHGRMMLWDIIDQLGYGNALYCDTDSVFIRESELVKIQDRISDKQIGMLKVEYITQTLRIFGCKDYSTDFNIKIKGVPKNADCIGESTFRYMQFLGQASHLSREVTDHYIVREVTKVNRRIYDKAIVDSHGNVTPFYLEDASLDPK